MEDKERKERRKRKKERKRERKKEREKENNRERERESEKSQLSYSGPEAGTNRIETALHPWLEAAFNNQNLIVRLITPSTHYCPLL